MESSTVAIKGLINLFEKKIENKSQEEKLKGKILGPTFLIESFV